MVGRKKKKRLLVTEAGCHTTTQAREQKKEYQQQEIEEEWDAADRASRRPRTWDQEQYHSESDHDQGGHLKSKKHRPRYEDDLSRPWLCKETDPFTARIQNFEVPKRTRMPVNVKTYDGTGDPDDHLKIFQATAKIERWAMPTWCHMFNSMFIGFARVWLDKLPPESIDNYEMLRKTFLGNYSQQKKYIKDPVEIHHIKQREGEPTEAFMERFKAESMQVSGAPECMRISGFMHGPAENRNTNKFCEFHGDKGHNTDECIHLRKQIEEAVKSGQLSHLVKEIKQGGKRGEQAKTAKKWEAPNKEKAAAIFMVQPWQRVTR
ncbi:reverse transcriptase domain-containing protein [Tanacetum coccineum]